MKNIPEEAWLTSANEWVAIFEALNIPQTTDYNYNQPDAPRILTVCRGGNCRSAAVGFLLKYKYRLDAMPISIEKNNLRTWAVMLEWADEVMLLERRHHEEFLKMYPGPRPVSLLDLGNHEAFRANPYDLDFLRRIDPLLQQHLRKRGLLCI